jgi:hypothetical protein
MSNIPSYISTLLKPTASKPRGRKVWSIDLETVWIPFFLATNTVQATAIPSEALGAPLRLAYTDDGEVKFTKTGRPVVRVAPEIAEQVKVVRENFVANLQTFTGNVMSKQKDAFKAQVDAAQKAGVPIQVKQEEDLDLAILRMQEQAQAVEEAEAAAQATPQAEPEKVAA